jgi:hypothetical protein
MTVRFNERSGSVIFPPKYVGDQIGRPRVKSVGLRYQCREIKNDE